MMPAEASIGCIVLAAGSGTRFGSDKRQAAFGNDTLLAQTLSNIAPVFKQRVLVLRAGDESLGRRFADDWQLIFAADADKGMGHSLAAAMSAIAGWNGAVVALADMPFVSTSTFVAVRNRLTPDKLVVPYFGTRRGNPVGIGSHYFTQVAGLQGDQGARVLLQQHAAAVLKVEVDDPGILRDVDTPAALTGQAD
jgi:molybdenum cofactor cytidylyltransferase